MKNITKEDYLQLLNSVLKEQKEEDLEINEDYLNKQEDKKIVNKFMYVDNQSNIDATTLTREEFEKIWNNQGNIFVGPFLIKINGFNKTPHITFVKLNIYDYTLDNPKYPTTRKINVNNDIRFESVEWKKYFENKKSTMISVINVPSEVVFDMIEWLQKLDKLAAFV